MIKYLVMAVASVLLLVAPATAQNQAAAPVQDAQLAALQPAPGQRINYAQMGDWSQLGEFDRDWYKRNFDGRIHEGNGVCTFPNFDVQYQIWDLRGPCFITGAQLSQAIASKKLDFTVTAQAEGVAYQKSQLDLACEMAPKFSRENSRWNGRVVFCQITHVMISPTRDLTGGRNYGFTLVDLLRNDRWIPMGFRNGKGSGWYTVATVKNAGNLPAGLPGSR